MIVTKDKNNINDFIFVLGGGHWDAFLSQFKEEVGNIEKYKDKTNDDQIIGHFGLGFYSAFMVAERVTIDTLSYKDGSVAVHWECDGGTEYDMEDGEKETVGTEITLFLNEESLEFANEFRVKEVIEKYHTITETKYNRILTRFPDQMTMLLCD